MKSALQKLPFRFALAFALPWAAPGLSAATDAPKPNIVVLYGDDIGFGDFSCYGATSVKTPHIDRLAAGGLRFTNAHAAAGTCTPSRFSILTGEYAFRQKGTGVLPGDAALIIRPGRETLPDMLRRAGYATAAVGKWHLGLGPTTAPLNWNDEIKPGPQEVGFDYSFIMAATGDRVPCVYVENHRVVGLTRDDPLEVNYKKSFPGEPTGESERDLLVLDWTHGHNQAVVNGIGRIGYMKGGRGALWKDDEMAKVFVRKATEFIEREKSRPFFLYLAAQDIHVPRVPNKDFAGQTAMGPRGDAIVEFDWMVGQVVETLRHLGLLDNTLIIVSSDNGPVLDDGYKDGANELLGQHKPGGPYRAGKYSSFEGGTCIPFITFWPGKISPGVSNALISQVDLLGSLAAMTGQSFDSTSASDSENMLPALLGRTATGRTSLVEQGLHDDLAIREGRWKYLPPGRVRDGLGPWTNVTIPAPGRLFDLSQDPGETNDLAAQQPGKAQELAAELESLKRKGRKNE